MLSVPKDGGKVSLLMKSVNELDQKIVLEIRSNYLGQLVVATGGLTR